MAATLHHVPSASLEYYSAIEENVEFICGLCPDFPRSLVEEVLVSSGNDRSAAMSILFDLKEQSDSAGVSLSGGHARHQHQHLVGDDGDHALRRSSRELFGVTAHLSRDGHARSSSASHKHSTASIASSTSSPVELVVYDLQPDSTVAKKVGLGAYHTGVVIYRHEFSFGGTRNLKRDAGKSGIWATRHLYATSPVIKKRVTVGTTYWTLKELQALLKAWGSTTWRVDDYHLLSRNCNHFADALLQHLAERSVLTGSTVAVPSTPVTSRSGGGAQPVTTPASTPKINVPAGASPLPGCQSTVMPATPTMHPATPIAAVLPLRAPPPLVEATPVFPLPPEEAKKVREAFQLPSWVNRAASLGNAVVPDFLFRKIVEALMPPVPEDDEVTSSSDVEPTPTSATR